jgi:hypothetical protein
VIDCCHFSDFLPGPLIDWNPQKFRLIGQCNPIKTCLALGLLSKQQACCAHNLSQMTPGGRPRGGGHNRLAWIDSSICIYSMPTSRLYCLSKFMNSSCDLGHSTDDGLTHGLATEEGRRTGFSLLCNGCAIDELYVHQKLRGPTTFKKKMTFNIDKK